eukprot:576628-Amphidinium_carterae.1
MPALDTRPNTALGVEPDRLCLISIQGLPCNLSSPTTRYNTDDAPSICRLVLSLFTDNFRLQPC